MTRRVIEAVITSCTRNAVVLYRARGFESHTLRYIKAYQFHNRNFYSDPDSQLYTFHGFPVLAVGGSGIKIPTTPETLAMLGNAAVRGGRPCAQIGLGCLYDALNRIILDAGCNRIKFNETAVAETQIANITIWEQRMRLWS